MTNSRCSSPRPPSRPSPRVSTVASTQEAIAASPIKRPCRHWHYTTILQLHIPAAPCRFTPLAQANYADTGAFGHHHDYHNRKEPDTHGVEWLSYSDRTEVRAMPFLRSLANLK